MLALSEDGYENFICKHFDPSVDVGSRYYEDFNDSESKIRQPIVDSSCIGSVTAWKSKKINNFALD